MTGQARILYGTLANGPVRVRPVRRSWSGDAAASSRSAGGACASGLRRPRAAACRRRCGRPRCSCPESAARRPRSPGDRRNPAPARRNRRSASLFADSSCAAPSSSSRSRSRTTRLRCRSPMLLCAASSRSRHCERGAQQRLHEREGPRFAAGSRLHHSDAADHGGVGVAQHEEIGHPLAVERFTRSRRRLRPAAQLGSLGLLHR